MQLRQRYNQRLGKNDSVEARNRNNRLTTTIKKLETADDSTMTTMSESTLSWKQSQHEVCSISRRIHRNEGNNKDINLTEYTPSECYPSSHRYKNNNTTIRHDIDNFSLSSDNSIRDKYAIHSTHGSDDTDNVNNKDAFCSMRACARDYSGCYGNLCPHMDSFRKQPRPPKDVVGEIPNKAASNANLVKFDVANKASDEWDFNVVAVGGPNGVQSSEISEEKKQCQGVVVVEVLGEESVTCRTSNDLPFIGQEEMQVVMSTTSLTLREILGINLSPPTRTSRLQKALSMKNAIRQRYEEIEEIKEDHTPMATLRPRLQRLQRALHRGKVAPSPSPIIHQKKEGDNNNSDVHVLNRRSFRMRRIFQSQNVTKQMEHSLATCVSPLRIAFGLILVQAIAMGEGESLSDDCMTTLNSDWIFHLLQWTYQNSNRTQMLIAWAHAFANRQIHLSSSIRLSSEIPTISGASSGTSDEDEEIDDGYFADYTPPVYIQEFERNLDEATDLTVSFVNAHNNDTDYDKDDDGLTEEVNKLPVVEQEISKELTRVAVNPNATMHQKVKPRTSSKDAEVKTKGRQVMDPVYNIILTLSSDSNSSDQEGSSLEVTEGTFDVHETRKAVLNAIQRLQGQYPTNEHHGVQKSLEQVQQKILNDLLQLDDLSTPYSSTHQSSEGSKETHIIEVPTNLTNISELSLETSSVDSTCAEDLKHLQEEDQQGMPEECESIPMVNTTSYENKEISSSVKHQRSTGDYSPEVKEYPSLMDTSASSDSIQESVHFRDRPEKSIILGDGCHEIHSKNKTKYFVNSTSEEDLSISASQNLNQRKRKTIWGSLLGANSRKKAAEHLYQRQMDDDWVEQRNIAGPGNLDEVECGRTTPRKPSLLLGSTSRSAFQQKREPDLVSKQQNNPEIKPGEKHCTAPVQEIHFEDIPHDISDIPFAGGGLGGELAHVTLNRRLQGDTRDEYNDQGHFKSVASPVWSMSPKLQSFSAKSNEITPSQGWSLSPNLTSLESDASAEKEHERPSSRERDLAHSWTEDSNLLKNWHAFMKDKRTQQKKEFDPFEAAKKIPEVFSEARSFTSQHQLAHIDEDKQTASEDMGVEAFLLADAAMQPNTTNVSDISGSTDAEYTDSEGTEWSKSRASSMSDMKHIKTLVSGGGYSVPFSNLQIGLQSVGTTDTGMGPSSSDKEHPLKAALERMPVSPRKQQTSSSPAQGIWDTISDIGNVVLSSWKCHEPETKRNQSKRQDEQKLLERLQGIRHY
jgi:hypothetical protein